MDFEFLKGIVPCGTSYASHACTVCDFYVLIQNIINFILFMLAPLATLAAIYIAFLFMFSGGSPAKITDAKGKLWLVVIGIFWVLGSWLVLNTILEVVANKGVFPWPWNQINCEVSKASSLPPTSESGGGASDGGGAFGGAGASGTWEGEGEFGEGEFGGGGASGTWEDAIQTDTPGYQAIDSEHVGLEQVDPGDPFSQAQIVDPAVTQIVSQADTNSVNKNLVDAIIQAESSGNTNAIHLDKDGQSSYGLMQVRPDTAKLYDQSLVGLTNAQIGEKLKNPDYNIQIGTAYLQDLAAKYGGDLNKVIAAYNGGPGANKASVDCPGLMRWQCQWDNKAQTIPNTGYAVTRDYVTKVNNYYSQLSK